MSKQNLWFLTLFSLVLVLSVYYITMPNNILKNKPVEEESTLISTRIEETSPLVSMRVSLEEERQNQMDTLQEQLTNKDLSVEEKNTAYEKLKYLNELQGKEEALEKEIKNSYNKDCFIKFDDSNVNVICIADKHDANLANNIMRLIQKSSSNKLYITVKFQTNS